MDRRVAGAAVWQMKPCGKGFLVYEISFLGLKSKLFRP